MKGLSPVIASILLIALTVAVASIVGLWVSGFTRTSTKTIEEKSAKELVCTYGGIRFSSVPEPTYSTTTGNFSGAVENTGTIVLGNVKLQVIYDNSSLETINLVNVLQPGEVYVFNVSISENFEIIRVTTNCTNVDDTLERSDIEIE